MTLCFVYAAIKEREQQAIIDGWRSRPYDLKVLKEYSGHEKRAAWKLLDYEPRYKGYYKRAEAGVPQDPEVAKQKARRTAARAQSPSSDSDSTASDSSPPAEMADLPRSQPKDLLAKFKKKPAAGPSAKAKPSAAGVSSGPAAGATAAKRGPPEAKAPSPPKKRSKPAGEISGVPAAPQKNSLAESGKDKAPRGAPKDKASGGASKDKTSGGASKDKTPAEMRPEAGGSSRLSSQAPPESTTPRELPVGEPWWPRMETLPGRPLNVCDRVASNILAVAAVAKMCALPLDMEAHRQCNDKHLLIKSLQSSILVSHYPCPHLSLFAIRS